MFIPDYITGYRIINGLTRFFLHINVVLRMLLPVKKPKMGTLRKDCHTIISPTGPINKKPALGRFINSFLFFLVDVNHLHAP